MDETTKALTERVEKLQRDLEALSAWTVLAVACGKAARVDGTVIGNIEELEGEFSPQQRERAKKLFDGMRAR